VGNDKMRNWKPQSDRDGTHSRGRLRRFQIAVMATSTVFAGLIASGTVASAHVIVSTTPNPDHGVIGTKDLVLNDSANLSNTTTDRDVKFLLFGVSDQNCKGEAVFTDTVEVTKDGTSTVSTENGFVPDHVGTYHWIAQILKDAEQGAVETASPCGEPVTITKAQPSITTTPSEGGPVGTKLSDSATVTGEFNPGGQNVSFYLYGPDNPDCHSDPGWLEKWEVPLQSDGTASTTQDAQDPTFTATAPGVYHWKSFLSADANNFSTSTSCGEPVTVGKAQPSMITTPSEGGVVGTEISDSVTVTGEFNPGGQNVSLYLYGPDNPDCNSEPGWLEKWEVPLKSDGTASTAQDAQDPTFKTAAAGVYHWKAFLSADANNFSTSTSCGEPVTIGMAQPTIATTASNGGDAPINLTDSATVSGGSNPTGTVTFKLYGPGDAACGTAIFTSADNALTNGAATTASAFNATTAGTYNWIATYSGDANNNSASTKCGDESVVVTKVTGGSQGITSGTGGLTSPSTGAGVSSEQLRLAIGLLVLGGGLALAGAAELISRRRAVRG
jgi:hypothetical protein